ncbi:MAG TPA: lysophospholipid acyltransferase family protein [Stellaceae bacterium]|nr:lysophospholipid acyltransferase family protein [Stellaceae bacterium]
MILLRSLLFQLLFYLLTAVMGVAGLPLLLLPGRWAMRYGTVWSRAVLALLEAVVGLSFEVRGQNNLPEGAALIAMKHQSAWDTFAAPVIFAHPVIVMKRELGWIPIYGWYVLKAGMIPIDRGAGPGALRTMVAAAAPAVAAGRPIIIFPEGTRTAVGAPPAYQPGVYALYRQLRLPLVPVAVNSGMFWGRRSFFKRPGRIVVEILPPLAPGGERRAVMAALETAIETATARLVAAAGG